MPISCSKLGKDGYVVNISRGSVIDQQALVAALTDQTIAGAGLDVYAKEPHAPDALTALPNVVLSPHIGGHTLESHVAMQDCVIANLEAFFAGKPLPYAVRSADASVRRCSRQMAQLVGIADDIDRGDLLAVDRHAHGVIEFAVEIEQGADGPVDHRRLDADVVAGVLGGEADEEARDLVGAHDRIERCGSCGRRHR